MTTLNNCQWAVMCINITCLKLHADISYRSKDISILDNHESRNRAAIIHPHAICNLVSWTWTNAQRYVFILGLWVKNNFNKIHWSATSLRKHGKFLRTISNWNRLNKRLYLLNYLRYHVQIWNVHYRGDDAWPCKRWSF